MNEYEKLLNSLTPRELETLDSLLNHPPPPWSALPGPQTAAFKSAADETFYGGAAGGGKTDLLLGVALAGAHRRSIIFRRTYPELRAVIERSREVLDVRSREVADAERGEHGKGAGERAIFNDQNHLWRIGGGHTLEFGALQTERDRYRWRGRAHDFIGWDEITEFTETQYRFVNAWCRTTQPGQRCRIVAAGNPPCAREGEWVKRYWAPWLDARHPNPAEPGKLRWYARIGNRDVERPDGNPFVHNGERIAPRSRTFIPARLADNPFLGAEYAALLQSQPEPLRSQLLYGDFSVGAADDEWQLIPTAWVRAAMQRWHAGKPDMIEEYWENPHLLTRRKLRRAVPQPLSALGCDIAHGGGDSTVIAKLYGRWFDTLRTYPGAVTDTGEKAAALILKECENNAPVGVDVIGVGASCYDALRARDLPVRGVNFAAESRRRDKTGLHGFVNLRAECYWRLREALDPDSPNPLALPEDPDLLADLTAPRWQPTARGIKIELKEEIKKRLGRSPDRGDAVAIALKAAESAPCKLQWA